MFGGSWSEEGSSRPTGVIQASEERYPGAAAGPLAHAGAATSAAVPGGSLRPYPSGATASAGQATPRAIPKRNYSFKMKQVLDEMAQQLEIPARVRVALADEDIVAMTIQFIKKMTPPDGILQPTREPDQNIPLEMYLAALDGFVLHVGMSGRVRYISQNVLEYLGFTAEEVIGRRILDFIHPSDRAELEKALAMGHISNECSHSASNKRLELFLRMRNQFQNQSFVSNNGGYLVIHCVGFVQTCKSLQGSQFPKTSSPTPSLWFVGRPLKPSFVLKYHANMAAFVIRTGLNLQPINADSELLRLLGYSAWEFSSYTLYQHVHPSDVVDFQRSHQAVLQKGQSLSHYYRMLCKSGEPIWIQTQFSLICNDFSASPNSIVSLNYVLGGERRIGTSSAPSSKILSSRATNASQFVGQQSLRVPASRNSCQVCVSDCCYNVANTAQSTPTSAPLQCDICDSHTTFSKCTSSHVEHYNAAHCQLRSVSGEQSTFKTTEIIQNRCANIHRYSESLSRPTASSELLGEPCTYRRSLSQSTADVSKRYEEQSCYPETNINHMAYADNSIAAPSQPSLTARPPTNNFYSYSTVGSASQRGENDLRIEIQEMSAKRNPSTCDINQLSYPTQQRSLYKSPETFNNFVSHPTMNSYNEVGRSSYPIDTYDTSSSGASMPWNSYQTLSESRDTFSCNYPTHSNTYPSQITGSNSPLVSASNSGNIQTSFTLMQEETKCGADYGSFGPNITPESNIGNRQNFAVSPVGPSTDCSPISSSCFLQPNNASMSEDRISSHTFDLPSVSDSGPGIPNASDNENFQPDAAILDEVMKQLDNRLGAQWETALQNFNNEGSEMNNNLL